MIFCVSGVWFVAAPILVTHYALAVYAITRLACCNVPIAQNAVWNVAILFGLYVGSVVFLIYYHKNKKRLRAWEDVGKKIDEENDKIHKDR